MCVLSASERKDLEPDLPSCSPSLFLPAATLPCSTHAHRSNLVSPFLSRPERQCPGGSQSLTWSLPLSAPPLPIAFTTTGASSANRFVSIGSRDSNFLNIPQQSQVGDAWMHTEVCTLGAHRGTREETGESWGGLFVMSCTPRLLPSRAASLGRSLRLPG